MADIVIDTQAVPAAPAAGKMIIFPESGGKRLTVKDDSGRTHTLGGVIRNFNTTDVVANAANTYLTGSGLTVPTGLILQVGTSFKWRMYATKTAAGVATPIWTVLVGTTGTTADTARLTFTGPAQTAAIDTGFIEITAILRNVGASGVLAGGLILNHNLAATGFANVGSPTLQATSAGFDTTVANLIIGVAVNPGAAGVWTHQVIKAEMLNI
jgi:hypothetical protein